MISKAAVEDHIDGLLDLAMNGKGIAADLDHAIESGWSTAFESCLFVLVRTSCSVIANRCRLDTADNIAHRRIIENTLQTMAMDRCDNTNASLSDCATRPRILGTAKLVDDDDLRRVVAHGLQHHVSLSLRWRNAHPTRIADACVRNSSIAANLA